MIVRLSVKLNGTLSEDDWVVQLKRAYPAEVISKVLGLRVG